MAIGTLIRGDCVQIMERMPAASVDFALTRGGLPRGRPVVLRGDQGENARQSR